MPFSLSIDFLTFTSFIHFFTSFKSLFAFVRSVKVVLPEVTVYLLFAFPSFVKKYKFTVISWSMLILFPIYLLLINYILLKHFIQL